MPKIRGLLSVLIVFSNSLLSTGALADGTVAACLRIGAAANFGIDGTLKNSLPVLLSVFPSECSTAFFLKMASKLNTTTDPKGEGDALLWKAIQDHGSVKEFVDQYMSKRKNKGNLADVVGSINETMTCQTKPQCTSERLNKVFESLIADKIVQRQNPDSKFSAAQRKVIDKILEKISDLHDLKAVMGMFKNNPPVYPLTNTDQSTKNMLGDRIMQEVKERPDFFMDFLMFFGGSYRKTYKDKDGNVQFPGNQYLTKKGADRYAGIPSDQFFTQAQDDTYMKVMGPARGNRKTYQNIPPYAAHSQRGLAADNVPSLQSPRNGEYGRGWVHTWQKYYFEPNDPTPYLVNAKKKGIPVVGGISGSTNIFLWTLMDLGVDLKPKEMRAFIANAWGTLASDGGHTLQEVLSASKIVSDSIEARKKTPEWKKAKKLLPNQSVSALKSITKNLSISGNPPGEFGNYSNFFKALSKDYPDFQKLLNESQGGLRNHFQSACGVPIGPQVPAGGLPTQQLGHRPKNPIIGPANRVQPSQSAAVPDGYDAPPRNLNFRANQQRRAITQSPAQPNLSNSPDRIMGTLPQAPVQSNVNFNSRDRIMGRLPSPPDSQ